jgi:hypothetical protein
MKIISFDVGIKNMAYCILTKSSTTNFLEISDWNVLNLMDEEAPDYRCTFIIPPKNKKSKEPIRHCGKVAKYRKTALCFCEKHAKSGPFLIPTKQMSQGSLKKMKMEELLSFGQSNNIFENQESTIKNIKRAELLEKMTIFFKEKCYEPITKKKVVGAGEMDLVKIGRNMKNSLGQVLEIHQDISHVIIENQISPIANRMKTIQGMLAQYFIMVNEIASIEFVSSANKLKQFTPRIAKLENTLTTDLNQLVNTDEKPVVNKDYKQHKTDGIKYCSQIIDKNHSFHSWRESLNTKKKDDLADCFLQGLWYFKNKNIITYADDLKINIV